MKHLGWIMIVIGMLGGITDLLVGKYFGGMSLVQLGFLYLIYHRLEEFSERDRPE